MKNIVFIYAGYSTTTSFEKIFDDKSAFEKVLDWCKKIKNSAAVVVATSEITQVPAVQCLKDEGVESFKVLTERSWNVALLLEKMKESVQKYGADDVIFTYADFPFLDIALTEKIIDFHKRYIAEYTFADGYPLGFAPEMIEKDALGIILELSRNSQKSIGELPVHKDSVFAVMKGDVNTFDIEAVISPKDYRGFRFDFSVLEKINREACVNLYNAAKEKNIEFSALALSDLAEVTVEVQKTVPAYYAIQIARNCATCADYNPYPNAFKKKYGALPLEGKGHGQEQMDLQKFSSLINEISRLSENAVVSLSVYEEPLTVSRIADYVSTVLEKSGLSVIIETDGMLVKPELIEEIANIVNIIPSRTNGMSPISWIVDIDAFSEETYSKIRSNTEPFCREKSAYQKALEAVSMLEVFFPGEVYPQFTRLNENEHELEGFYRYWHDAKSPSKGKVIIQKYDCFCKTLPERKPADLSPLRRNPCWHLKRDMTVLADGNVPLCKEFIFEESLGNVFSEGLENLWNRFNEELKNQTMNNYGKKCGDCDEYYTFNF